MKSIAKTALLKQLRAKYPIAIERCHAILDHCKWDLCRAESHLKTALATQFSQNTGTSPTIANEWLEKYDFDVSRAIQHFKSAQQSITAQILWSGSSSRDKVWRIFRAIEESQKSGRHGSTLESNFYEFCESLYYCEHETIDKSTYAQLSASARHLGVSNIVDLLAYDPSKADDSFFSKKLEAIKHSLYDELIDVIQVNIQSFP
jgi:hypothetical protein